MGVERLVHRAGAAAPLAAATAVVAGLTGRRRRVVMIW
jgi:hypothetical protein